MTHFNPYPYAAFVALSLLLIGPSGCNPAAQDLPQRVATEALKRFEITLAPSILIRMPLARISPDEKLPEPVRIGIPTWH